jgi:5,6-dimethylbenzimidazole synthase/cob(I)alamin adenosyltransferase
VSEHGLPPAWRRGVYEAIGRRRDVRRFRPDPVAPDVLARILWAAHHAGSVGYSQPWSFLVVDDRAVRQRIRDHVDAERVRAADDFGARKDEYLRLKLEGILDAAVNVAVVCDRQRHGPAVIGRATMRDADLYSTCGAIQNLWLAARAEGLGVGWVSILEPACLAEVLHLPAHVVPVAYLCIGAPRDGFADRPELESAGWLPRLPLAEVVRGDRWDAPPPAELAASLAAADPLAPPPKPAPGQGLVVVYTGQGKGKTTAALGLVMRALGRGYRVGVVQYIKGKWKTGERLFAAGLPGLDFHVMGEGFTWESDDLSRDRRAARAAWDRSATLIAGGHHDIVILDELTYAISYGFVDEAEILAAIDARPPHVHVVITGRHATPALIERADLVTDMAAVKHPFARGVRAQPGLDF